MPTTTANLGLTLPTPNVDTGWGSTLNTDFTTIDNLFASNGTGTSVGLQVGSGRTLVLGGTMVLGAGDGTGTVTAPTIRGAARTGTNVTGANLTIDAPNGTGTGGSGGFLFRTAPAGASGTTANTMQNSVFIDNAGSVGIGVTNPSAYGAKLVVSGSNASVVQSSGVAQISAGSGSVTAFMHANSAGVGAAGTATNHEYWLLTNNTERLRIGTAGQIGIAGANYGTAGQVLTSNGAGSSVSWTTPVPDSITLLGTISTSTGNNITLSGINLTGCKFVYAICENVDPTVSTTTAATFSLGGAQIRTATGAGDNYVIFDLALTRALVFGGSGMTITTSTLTTASTSITASTTAANFNGGSIRIYSAR